MKNKRGFEFSFGWIFAIIVGAVIIVLAVYAASKFTYTERKVQDSEIAQQLGVIINPLETGVEESKSAQIKFSGDTRISFVCDSKGNFGSNKISISSKSGIGSEWQSSGVAKTMYNKYLFSQSLLQGNEISVFSKPLEMPYKVGDMMFIWSSSNPYCFVNPPREIEDEMSDLYLASNKTRFISIVDSKKECPKLSKTVCFSESGCSVDVSVNSESVTQNKKTVHYQGSLIYGAIFSDPATYECQVVRLMKRTSELSLLYLSKSQYVSRSNGCSSNMQQLLTEYANKTLVSDSNTLTSIYGLSEEIRRVNDGLVSCKIF